MARPFPVAVRAATDEAPRPAISLEQRLESIALPLKKLAASLPLMPSGAPLRDVFRPRTTSPDRETGRAPRSMAPAP